MPVKDLVGLYETRTASSSSRPRPKPSATHTSPGETQDPAPAVDGLPPPSLYTAGQMHERHEFLSQSPDNLSNFTASTTLLDDSTVDTHDTHELTADVTDELNDYKKSRLGRMDSVMKKAVSRETDAFEMKSLLPRKKTNADSDHSASKQRSLSSEPTLAEWPRDIPELSSHTPIPATTIFARNAAPLSLPELDDYISTITPPPFHAQTADKGKISMFPPLQRLAASGKTLEDLEKNAQIPSWYQNRNKIVGVVASLALSITVRSLLFCCNYSVLNEYVGLECLGVFLQLAWSH